MAMVASLMKTELGMAFMEQPAIGITPGQNITKAFKNYLSMSMNSGGQPFATVMPEPFGVILAKFFKEKCP